MSGPTVAELLHLVDRAERGSLLAEEAVQLRAGIRALGAAECSRGIPDDHRGPEKAREGP